MARILFSISGITFSFLASVVQDSIDWNEKVTFIINSSDSAPTTQESNFDIWWEIPSYISDVCFHLRSNRDVTRWFSGDLFEYFCSFLPFLGTTCSSPKMLQPKVLNLIIRYLEK